MRRFLRNLPRRKKVLLGVSIVVFSYTVATSVMQYFLPFVVERLTTSFTVFGIIMGLPWLFSLLTGSVVGGILADAVGFRHSFLFFGSIFIVSIAWIIFERKIIRRYETSTPR